jgi:hypothetical protein
MRDRTWELSKWRDVLDFFETQVHNYYAETNRMPLSDTIRQDLMRQVDRLHESLQPDTVKRRLQNVISSYRIFSGEGLGDIYAAIKIKLMDWDKGETGRIQTLTALLDRRYGSRETIKATTLGNVIAAYNHYSSKRYRIEDELFWPHLRYVMKPEYLTLVQEPRILLDFSLTVASLGAAYGYMALLAGPWLYFNPWFWGPLAIIGFAISFFFYRLSITAAYQVGEMVRASFDLFRLDLMAALNLPHPATFKVEQDQWEELSRIAVYGEAAKDFALRKRLG